MDENKGLHLLYKRLGETPNECVLRFKKENTRWNLVSMTYAGRLDPMAEGLLLVLSGDKIQDKDQYLNLRKTYECEILWGFETDSLDLLGRVVASSQHIASREDIEKELKKSVGKFEQKYPAYSSKPVSSRPLFQWAREGKLSEIQIPSHKVEIFDVGFISRRLISKAELLKDINSKVNSVSGDFRQKEILEKWEENLPTNLSTCEVDKFEIDTVLLTVSSGFYVRQFVSDLAGSLGSLATTFHIKRTKIGDLQIPLDGD